MKGEKIDEVKTMKYLGSLFVGEESCDYELELEQNWGCIKGDWSDEIRSPREKRTKARKSKGIQCNGGCFLLCCMGVKAGQYKNGRSAGYRRKR